MHDPKRVDLIRARLKPCESRVEGRYRFWADIRSGEPGLGVKSLTRRVIAGSSRNVRQHSLAGDCT